MSARTQVKEGSLRVTLIALCAGSQIAEDSADGPITVQPLTGSIHCGGRRALPDTRQLLTLRAGIRSFRALRRGRLIPGIRPVGSHLREAQGERF